MSSRKDQKDAARAEREAHEQGLATKQARKQRLQLLAVVVGVAAVVVGVAVALSLGGGATSDKVEGASEVTARLDGVPQAGLRLGKADAPVTLVEFADLKCPFCADFSNDVLPALIDRYVKTGKLQIVFKPQTIVDDITGIQGDSLAAATMAVALGEQDKAWNFIDLFYINQKPENEQYATDAYLLELAGAIPGANGQEALDARQSPAVTKVIETSAEEFAAAGFDGTPSFLVGATGTTLKALEAGQLTVEEFTGPIEDVLAIQ